MTAAPAMLWAALALLVYTYAGYPLLLWAWARSRPRGVARGPALPTVSIVLVVHDEAARIEARLRDLLAADYPRELLEIIVASDGSSDGTAARARACDAPRLRVLEFQERRGKSATLNDAVARARGEVVVFADARQRFAPGALRALVAQFGDPAVGAVSGELVPEQGAGSELGAGLGCYRRYEQAVRRWESAIDSCIGVTGAIYAIRRALFEPIAAGTILDDVAVPMRIARRGWRVTVEPAARAHDPMAATADAEFARKLRTIGGTAQLLRREPWLLDPSANRLWLQTVSHKLLRLLSPVFLLTAFAANLVLIDDPRYAALFALQLGGYGAAMAGRAARRRGRRAPALLNIAYAFCLLNWATVAAVWRCCTHRMPAAWDRPTDHARGGLPT